MVNFKIVSKILGQLLLIESVMMAGCMIMAFCYHEDDTMAFIISVVVTIGAAFILKYLGRNAENTLGRRDAYLVVTFTWIVFSIFGALPFLISGYVTTPTDAFFETMSGFTTTGASVIDDVERLPHGMLFWRSLTQFIGGLDGRRKREGVCGRSYRTDEGEAASAAFDHGQMDLDRLYLPHRCLRFGLLGRRHGMVRQHQLFDGNNRYGRILNT